MTLLADVAAASAAVAATRKRTEKRVVLADLLRSLDGDEIPVVAGFLIGEVRQGRIGVGWAGVSDLVAGANEDPEVTVAEIDDAITRIGATTGEGSQASRHQQLAVLTQRMTVAEVDFLRRLLIGDLRQGALAGVVTDAIAAAADLPLALVRRAAMLSSDLGEVARLALVDGADALASIGLEPLRAVEPMLAATSASVAAAVDEVGEASVEWKLDGARIQVHRSGDEVRIYTRNLNDVTDRLPGVGAFARGLAAESFVLDGEILGFMGPDAPQAFQDTMSTFSRENADGAIESLAPWFFDILHLDGVDLIDEPLRRRRTALAGLVGDALVPGVITGDPADAQAVLDDALARGHEGVMVKAVESVYDAGRRGKSWRKVKPVHTLDLVVLGVEWGSGRRTGTLSNLHLGALDPVTRVPVMVGKTFKGLTDELLRWQTERFLELEVRRTQRTVFVDPVQVVEIALDGAQASTRYPGGVALRFARVRGYRHDKTAADADTIDAVRALLPRARQP